MQGKSYAKDVRPSFTIVCLAGPAAAATLESKYYTRPAESSRQVCGKFSGDGMNLADFIKNRLCMRARAKNDPEAQDLFLYRQLRRSENRLHEIRECLNMKLAAYKAAEATCEYTGQGQGCDASELGPGTDDSRPCLDALRLEIARLESEAARCEAEYQLAQMNVRTYFYLETCPGRMQEHEAAAGHSPR